MLTSEYLSNEEKAKVETATTKTSIYSNLSDINKPLLYSNYSKSIQHVHPMNGETPDKKNSLTCKKQVRLFKVLTAY